MPARRVTVFCSSSGDIEPVYLEAAAELGAAIAREGWELVYGGNNLGAMGALADGCRAAGGCVIGVTPQLFVDKGYIDKACRELIVTPDMRSRKARMEELGDAFVAMPGGFGTLEELSEMLVGRLLKYHAKPVDSLQRGGVLLAAGGVLREDDPGAFRPAQGPDGVPGCPECGDGYCAFARAVECGGFG